MKIVSIFSLQQKYIDWHKNSYIYVTAHLTAEWLGEKMYILSIAKMNQTQDFIKNILINSNCKYPLFAVLVRTRYFNNKKIQILYKGTSFGKWMYLVTNEVKRINLCSHWIYSLDSISIHVYVGLFNGFIISICLPKLCLNNK